MTSPGARDLLRITAAAGVVALVLAGCTGGQETTEPTSPATAAPSPTVEVSVSAEPSPSPTDPFAVPDEIDAAYVERVLNEINRLDAELTKDILRRPVEEGATELPESDRASLEAIYDEPLLEFSLRGQVDLLRSTEQREDLRQPDEFGQLRYAVEEVLTTAPCVVARVERDFSETDAEPDVDTTNLAFAFLVRSPDSNPSGWRLARVLITDAAPNSDDEAELRTLTYDDIRAETPEACS